MTWSRSASYAAVSFLSGTYAGVAVTLLIALSAHAIADYYGAPVMLLALLMGMSVSFFRDDVRCRPGIDFCARTVLRIGVSLLGLRITLDQIVAMGWNPFIAVVVGICSTIAFALLACRMLRMRYTFGVLTGGSVSICGASAAIAIAAVLPRRSSQERELSFTIIGVTALSTIAMVVYPAFSGWLGLSDLEAGIFLGGTIHDVAQVVGAGYSVSKPAGDIATVVKLSRVAMLLPVVLVVLLLGQRTSDGATPGIPVFLLAFIVLVAMNSLQLVPPSLVAAGVVASRWCLVVAIAAVGVKTVLSEIATLGARSVLLLVSETVFLVGIVLSARAFYPWT